MRKILVPVDGSEASLRAAEFAAELARVSGASVTLVHVFDAPSVVAMGLRALDGAELQRTRDNVSKPTLDRAQERMGGLEGVERKSELGDPSSEILSLARGGHYDHVVMGSRGLSPLAELTLGSVSDRVVRGAPCPVTIVR